MKSFHQSILDRTNKAKALQHDTKLSNCIAHIKQKIEKCADAGQDNFFISFDNLSIDKYFAQLIVDFYNKEGFESGIKKESISCDLPGPNGGFREVTGIFIRWIK